MSASQCMTENCNRPPKWKGLCSPCYSVVKRLVDKGDETWGSLAEQGLVDLSNGKGNAFEQALAKRGIEKFSLTRVQLRHLVDCVWQECTESEAVPATDWADKIIDEALKEKKT